VVDRRVCSRARVEPRANFETALDSEASADQNAGRVSDPTTFEHDPHIGRVLAERYLVVSLLGSGGMGSVYRAEHVLMQKPVAVKILHRHMTTNAEVVARFEREAVVAGRIDHPNVAAATDFGKLEDGSFYLVLEYVEGTSLADVIDRGALAPYRALAIARQIADGLSAAHAAGIVHRDLKPDNVLLVERDGVRDLVKVLDFGIAKLRLEEGSGSKPLTQIGTIFGTPQYMSPEQGQGRTVDARSDLYALGVILYEMLTARRPFDADDLVVVITRHVTEPPPPLPASLPAPIRELVERLLAKKPEQRPESAARLVELLDELLADAAASARTAGAPRVAERSAPEPLRLAVSTRTAATAPKAQLRAVLSGLSGVHRAIVRRAPVLDRPVTIGGSTFPLLGLVGGAAGLALLGALLALLVVPARGQKRRGPEGTVLDAGVQAPLSEDRRHRELVQRAMAGDQAALAALDLLPQKQRHLEDARALGHGRCAAGEWSACMAAYKAGAFAFPALQKDDTLLADVRRAAFEPTASEDALRLAAHQLGPKGLDLLWDVWLSSRQKPELQSVNHRARQFLDDSAVREHATRELGLVLELEHAEKRKRCGDAKSLLPKVLEYGDDRVLPILDRFKVTRGCGFVDLGDCWECLRANKELPHARDAASARPGPTFLGE
jgi:eukaryotic-like serine/threonine-protein kinase